MARIRERLPFVVFLLLLILLVMVVGFACACLTDHPMQTIDRALSAVASMPAVLVVWTWMAVVLLAVSVVVQGGRAASGRASPAFLQRFLF